MPLITIPIEAIELYALIFMRVIGLLITLPVFSMTQFGYRFRAAIAASFTLLLALSMAHEPIALPQSGGAIILAAIAELFLGLSAGYLVSWVVEAAVIGGQMIGFQMGFAIVNVIDPATGSSVSLMASFQGRVALAVFVVSGFYRMFLEAIAISYQLAPLGLIQFSSAHAKPIIEVMGLALQMSITFAATPIVSLLLSKVVLGIIARTVPQMNVFIVGFPLTIGVGFLAAAAMMPFFVHAIQGGFNESLQQMFLFMRSATP